VRIRDAEGIEDKLPQRRLQIGVRRPFDGLTDEQIADVRIGELASRRKSRAARVRLLDQNGDRPCIVAAVDRVVIGPQPAIVGDPRRDAGAADAE
jgi:hypothetical protein